MRPTADPGGAIGNDLKDRLAFLEGDPDVLMAMLFGSATTGHLRPDSDLDVAVYLRTPMDSLTCQRIVDAIAEATGRAVDLVDLSQADGILLREILHSGVIITLKEKSLPGALSEKLLGWQEDFQPQIQRILERRLERFISPLHGS